MARIIKPNFTLAKKSTSPGAKPVRPPMPIYQLYIALSFTDPLVWRRIQICGGQSLAELHRVLQISFGWDDADQHQFLVGKVFYKCCHTPGESDGGAPRHDDESLVSVHALADAMKFIFTYIYDGGPGWEGEITLEEILPGSQEHFAPRLLAGAGWTGTMAGEETADVEIDPQAINPRLAACYPVIRPIGLRVTAGDNATDDIR